jgi:hypothetical protein
VADRNEGGCVCGGVRYVAQGDPERVTICHCTWCQRRTGSAFGVEVVFRIENVALAGEALRTWRHVSDQSGRWLDQDFCSRCGANIGLTLEAVPGIRTIAAGLRRPVLDHAGALRVSPRLAALRPRLGGRARGRRAVRGAFPQLKLHAAG